MNLTVAQKRVIRQSFAKMQSSDDLVSLLNNVQRFLYDPEHWDYRPKSFTTKAVHYFAYSKSDRYKSFQIPKKNGGYREISSPHRYLKLIQRLLNACFQVVFTPKPQATGFVAGSSVVKNASYHVGRKYVYNIDLKDFFPSISVHRVRAVLAMERPFGLNKKMANLLANLCCHNGSLPQGAPTSPVLSNLICIRLDRKMYRLSQRLDFTYTRYADDITVSADENIFSENVKNALLEIIKEEGFSINPLKERLQRYGVFTKGQLIRERQVVTGIIVNKKVNVSQTYIRNLRAILHNWEKYGYEVASRKLTFYYQRELGFERRFNQELQVPPLVNFVSGKLEYMGMVRGKTDPRYLELKLKFDSLCTLEEGDKDSLEQLLSVWEESGLKKAMDLFYNKRNLLES